MMTTPGPWKQNNLLVTDDLGVTIAHCTRWEGHGVSPRPDVAEANARLIAATPTMLAALKRADALITMLWEAVPWGQTFDLDVALLNEVPGEIQAAIRKAEGT